MVMEEEEEEQSYVVVFPTMFARGEIRQLIVNIKEILRIRGQPFASVKRDGDLILVHANDPVFAASAINLLFGIKRVAIARRTGVGFDELVSKITSIGGNLLLKGERFIVRVEGTTKGFTAKDAEIAVTSRIIEKTHLGAVPGTEERFDRELYTYLTKKNGYVCIFSDAGMWGVPKRPRSGERRTACPIYDELSAISCVETVRQGYDVDIMIVYKKRQELLRLVKMINRLIPRLVREEVVLEFLQIEEGGAPGGAKKYLAHMDAIMSIMMRRLSPGDRISLAVPPAVFPDHVVDSYVRRAFGGGLIPLNPLAGVDAGMYRIAGDMGFGESDLKRLERVAGGNYAGASAGDDYDDTDDRYDDGAIAKTVTIRAGVNNVHDILDSL